jgi:hypothetical protein
MIEDKVDKYRAWKKEHPDFPLTVHPSGQWSRKVLGKVHYFGPLGDPDAAMKNWLADKDFLLAGMEPPAYTEGAASAQQLQHFITLKDVAERLSALCDKADALFTRYGKAASGPRVYTVAEAAEMLSTTERSIERLLSRGQLAYIDVCVIPGSVKPRKRIAEADLLAFLEVRRVMPPAPGPRMRRRRRMLE